MKFFNRTGVWIFILAVMAGCGGSDSGGTNKNVYAAGSIKNSNGEYLGGYWKNGAWNEFSNPYSANGTGYTSASSIAVSGSDVYVGGESGDSSNNLNMAGYWKNGIWVELANPYNTGTASYNGGVNSIAVADGKVYAGGYCYNGTICIAGYWVSDGSAGSTDPTWVELKTYDPDAVPYMGQVNSIAVADGKVYVSASYDTVTGYWVSDGKTKTWTEFTNPYTGSHGGSVDSMTVADGKVYATGYYSNGSTYRSGYWASDGTINTWVELNSSISSYDEYVNSIAVADGKVYVGGYCDNGTFYVAGYWVSDGTTKTWTEFDNPYGSSLNNLAVSISVSGSDLYLAVVPVYDYNGVKYQHAGYYKNGIWTEFDSGHSLTDYPDVDSSLHIVVQ